MVNPSPDGTAQQMQGGRAQFEPHIQAALDHFEMSERKAAALLLDYCHGVFNRRLLPDGGTDDDMRDAAIEMALIYQRHARLVYWLLEEMDHQPTLRDVPWVLACCNAGSLVTANHLHDEPTQSRNPIEW